MISPVTFEQSVPSKEKTQAESKPLHSVPKLDYYFSPMLVGRMRTKGFIPFPMTKAGIDLDSPSQLPSHIIANNLA